MKIAETTGLPRTAGQASLEFTSIVNEPARKGNRIILPFHPTGVFFPLLQGVQFLFGFQKYPDIGPGAWFGGTDESVFLTRVLDENWKAFNKGGERAFFRSLMPRIIRRLQQQNNCAVVRQGDVYAAKLPFTWEQIPQVVPLFTNFGTKPRAATNARVADTRHRLTGRCVAIRNESEPMLIGEGTLKAPGHSDRVLEGPHLIVAANLD